MNSRVTPGVQKRDYWQTAGNVLVGLGMCSTENRFHWSKAAYCEEWASEKVAWTSYAAEECHFLLDDIWLWFWQ